MTEGPRVLVVEDDEQSRLAMAAALSLHGLSVDTAEHGLQAIEKLSAPGPLPQVIVCDLIMPMMGGWEFCRWKGKRPEFGAIPVIIVSSFEPPPELLLKGLASAFVRKPVDLDTLAETIRRLGPADAG